jgi:glycine cleavage system H protein
MNPKDLKYSQEHEWVRLETENVASIGITAFAAEELGDVVFVEVPDKDAEITQFQQLGEIESVKAVSELFSPISGRVTERNERVLDNPELVNSSPYGDGWLLKVLVTDVLELDNLMTAEQYETFVASRE